MYSLDLQDIDISKSITKFVQNVFTIRVSNITFDVKVFVITVIRLMNLNNHMERDAKRNRSFKRNNQKNKIRSNKKYDCIVGVSGGTDSSYLIYLSKKWDYAH